MKYLVLLLALFTGMTFAQEVAVSPGCPAQVAVGPGPIDCSPPVDPRRESIRAFFNAYETQPQIVFSAMTAYGVDLAELSGVMDYRVNVLHWMRLNKAPNGLGGLKVWDGLSIDQFLIWSGVTDSSIDNPQLRVMAQDVLDRAERRKNLYIARGWPVPDSIAPWERVG